MVLKQQVHLASESNDVMFWSEDVGCMDRSREGHAMRCMYLQGVYSAAPEEGMRNLSGNMLWSEGREG